MDKLVLSVDELAKTLGVSRPLAYQIAKQDGFPAIRISDKRIVIPKEGLRKWLEDESNKA